MILPLLKVKNVDASVKFYVEKLGFNNAFNMQGPDGVNAFAFVDLGKPTIGLSLTQDANTGVGQGVEFMIYVGDDTDIDAYYADVQKKGVKIEKALATQYWGDRTFTIHDPDGYVLTMSKTVQTMTFEQAEANRNS